jgi:hypothetical protein
MDFLGSSAIANIVLSHTNDDIHEAIINPATFPAFQQVKIFPDMPITLFSTEGIAQGMFPLPTV